MEQPRILITGGTGFAGSHLVEALLEQGYSDIHVTSFSGEDSFIARLIGSENIHRLDLTDSESTAKLLQSLQPDQMYHLAALAFVGKSFDEADRVLMNNIAVQQSVLLAVRDHCKKARLLVVGSAEEYGVSISEEELPVSETHPFRPINPYAVSKISQDMLSYAYFVSYDLDIVTVRPFNHIGERQSTEFAIPAFTKQIVAIERGEQTELKVGDLSTVRDFTDVKDVVRAYILVMNKGKSGEAYNIGSGTGVLMSAIVEQLSALATKEIVIVTDKSRLRPHDIPKMVANNAKMKLLGWEPTIPLEETLRRVMSWYRNN
ncbi:MAG: GDP-mannose 4,6-dehydratase [Patescibacteria group bacterium]|nr:MAG: GDP-mannose 4,6-dehydratase [Patescibacteria group bacterium]